MWWWHCVLVLTLVYSYKTHIEISADEIMYLEFASEQSKVGDKQVIVSWESEKSMNRSLLELGEKCVGFFNIILYMWSSSMKLWEPVQHGG